MIVSWLRCRFGRHEWEIHPYPSRIFEGWKWEALPYLIEDPLIWKMEYEECARCKRWRWIFRDEAALASYSSALQACYENARSAQQ